MELASVYSTQAGSSGSPRLTHRADWVCRRGYDQPELRSGSEPLHTGVDLAQVCTGRTNHAEVVRVVYEDPVVLPDILRLFWERHNPTTKFQQGNDRGSQYRSCIY